VVDKEFIFIPLKSTVMSIGMLSNMVLPTGFDSVRCNVLNPACARSAAF